MTCARGTCGRRRDARSRNDCKEDTSASSLREKKGKDVRSALFRAAPFSHPALLLPRPTARMSATGVESWRRGNDGARAGGYLRSGSKPRARG